MLKFQWRGGQDAADMGETGGGGEMKDLKRRLQEEGLDPAVPDDQKLHHLWQLYVKTEVSLKASLSSIEELRAQQAEEMREVENYVEHIRSLSDEREALTLEFEAENEQLKADIVRLQNALDAYKSDEIREMLLQQSLEEIADGTTSEQIAYLLVERARLMDELEAVEGRATVVTQEGPMTAPQLLEVLEAERTEFEEELDQQRESLREVKDDMRRAHEEEVTTMMSENEKLQDMLDEAKLQTSQLQQAVAALREQLRSQEVTITEKSSSQMEVETERAAREKAEYEMRQLQCQLVEMKADTATLVESERISQDELNNFRRQRDSAAEMQTKLEHRLTEKEELISTLQETNQKLASDVRRLELQLQLAQDEADDLRQQSDGLVVSSGDDLQSRLKNELDDLKRQNEQLRLDLTTAKSPRKEETPTISTFSQPPDNRLEELRADHEKEVNTLKAKIRSLEQKASSLEGDLATSQREVWSQQSDFKKRLAQLRAENGEGPTLDLRQRRHSDGRIAPHRNGDTGQLPLSGSESGENSVTESKLREVNERLRENTERLREVTAEKDELFNLLESHRQQTSSLRQELAVNMQRISDLEKSNYQSATETQDLKQKLSTALESAGERENKVKVLERRESEERLTAVYTTVDSLKTELQHINVELTETKLRLRDTEDRLQVELSHNKTHTEGLNDEVDRLHVKHKGELQAVSQRLEAAFSDVSQLKKSLTDREEEVTRLRNESNLLQSSESKLKIRLETEEKKRSTLELNNTSLNEQNEKAWSQVKELSIKVSTLEATNENLRQELDRKTSNFRDTESQLSRRVTEQGIHLDASTRRAETAETKSAPQAGVEEHIVQSAKQAGVEEHIVQLYGLQRDLESALTQLQTAEEQLRESASLRSELLGKRDEICRLRDQLQDEKLQKTYAHQGSEELTTQLTLLREKERAAVMRSNDLQHMLLDVEAKLDTMKDQTKSTSTIRVQAETDRKTLVDAVTRMQFELESLHTELTAATERYELQVRKYNDRKQRTKNKLQKARELFHSERTKCREEVEELQTALRAVRTSAAKDAEWKEQLEDTNKKLLVEKRELLSQVAEQEEVVHDQNRSLSVLQVRSRYLEEENQNLTSRIDSLNRQKCNLDKLVKEYQLERHKEAINTMSNDVDALMSPRISSSLGFHVTSPTDEMLPSMTHQSHLVDALVSPRVASPNAGIDMYRPVPIYGGMVGANDPDSDGVEL